jgi:hypothetical protein
VANDFFDYATAGKSDVATWNCSSARIADGFSSNSVARFETADGLDFGFLPADFSDYGGDARWVSCSIPATTACQ